jgi:hypothetical protein
MSILNDVQKQLQKPTNVSHSPELEEKRLSLIAWASEIQLELKEAKLKRLTSKRSIETTS